MRRLFIAPILFAATALVAAEIKSSAADYELRGFFGRAADMDISLRNTRTGKSQWYHLGDRAGGVLVEKADYKTGVATIVVNGERRTLRLAGEGVTESEKEKDARILRHGKILEGFMSYTWEIPMKQRQHHFRREAGSALFKSHPEYFTEEGSHTPEAKAAILRIMKESILAGMAVPKEDGTLIPPPENLNELLESTYGDISLSMSHGASEGLEKSAENRNLTIEIHGHPVRATGGLSAEYAGGIMANMDSIIKTHLTLLEYPTVRPADWDSKK
jgi:hypothetical protein